VTSLHPCPQRRQVAFLKLQPEKGNNIAHVKHAWEWVKPGGRLVAVMGMGWTFRQDRKAVEFREWVDEFEGAWVPLPDNAFRESGTDVRAVYLVVDKPDEGG